MHGVYVIIALGLDVSNEQMKSFSVENETFSVESEMFYNVQKNYVILYTFVSYRVKMVLQKFFDTP